MRNVIESSKEKEPAATPDRIIEDRRLRQSQGEPEEIYHWSHEKRDPEVNKKGAACHMWRLFKTLRNKRL